MSRPNFEVKVECHSQTSLPSRRVVSYLEVQVELFLEYAGELFGVTLLSHSSLLPILYTGHSKILTFRRVSNSSLFLSKYNRKPLLCTCIDNSCSIILYLYILSIDITNLFPHSLPRIPSFA